MNFPPLLQLIFDAVAQASQEQGIRAYAIGGIPYYFILGEKHYLKNGCIKILLESSNFEVLKFYHSLKKNIIINEEVENTPEKYCVLSKPYILDFEIVSKLDTHARFNVDKIYYDIIKQSVEDTNGAVSEKIFVSSLVDPKEWTTEDILGFAFRVSTYPISEKSLLLLKNIQLSKLKEPISVSFTELLIQLLLVDRAGTALKFIVDTFSDGKSWLFENLLNVMISLDVPAQEDTYPEQLFVEKNFELLDVYGEFFLSRQQDVEQAHEKTLRLNTLLRLLFDIPNLKIDIPYIDKVSILSASMLESIESSPEEVLETGASGVIKLFADPVGCEYGQCPVCDPSDCEAQGKGPCCCCHSIDIIDEARFNCHQQVVLSCNANATSPGPGELPFPVGCDDCRHACEGILGISDHTTQSCDDLISHGTSEGWWTLPIKFSPCSCDCLIPSSTCQLTCVTCENLFCQSETVITGADCNYNISLIPGSGCCGIPAVVDWVFVVDFSGSMGDNIAAVRSQIGTLIIKMADKGAEVRWALVVFGAGSGAPVLSLDFTADAALLISALGAVPSGGFEPDMAAMHFAATQLNWGTASANFMMIVADEDTQRSTSSPFETPNGVIDACNFNNITVFVVDGGSSGFASPERALVANATNGQVFSLDTDFADVVDDLNITVFPTDCDCVDTTPIPLTVDLPECKCADPFDIVCLNSLPDYCYDIPIKRCFPDQDCQAAGFCDQATPLNACGNTILIEPENVNMICCADVGFGCDCEIPNGGNGEAVCCGPTCEGMEVCDINGEPLFNSLEDAQDFVWCECFAVASFADPSTSNCNECCCPDVNAGAGDSHYPCDQLDPLIPEQKALLDESPPRCCQCNSFNASDCCGCCMHFVDGLGGFDLVRCRPDVDDEIAVIWETCGGATGPSGCTGCTGPTGPIGGGREDFIVCDTDKCIVGEPTGSLNENRCGDAGKGCTTIRNPAVTVLNNGIGLVAYESMTDVSSIKIQQFKTSSRYKILPNREFNFGRLQHQSKWFGSLAKLYHYENLPNHIINSSDTVNAEDPSTWADMIVFKNGPLQSQIFPLVPEVAGESPFGTDSIGDFVSFLVAEDLVLSKQFPSSDDVYNVKWFLIDKEDGGLIGDAIDITTEGKEFIISNNSVVSNSLQIPAHTYNGKVAPIAYPSLANANNYSNAIENSHFIYLSYQALEDNKWNIYLRQIRLSEYEKEEQISEEIQMGNLEDIAGLVIDNVVYRVVCTSDNCAVSHDDFALSRTIIMEVLLPDGREVFNLGLSGEWGSLCPGQTSSIFPKRKVFVELKHTIVADRCPDQFGFDSLFYNWHVGQEFLVQAEDISAVSLFLLLSLTDDSAVSIGEYNKLKVGDVVVSVSSVGAIWYDNITESTWSVISDSAFDILSKYKGLDISEPILVTDNELGHCTQPVVKVNNNNDVFIVYEYTVAGLSGTGVDTADLGSHQITLIGTNFPSTSLPVGVWQSKQIDDTLNYFLQPIDFTYKEEVTSVGDGLNQLPDMFIDINDVVHITWQSNRDGRWEVYYTNTEENVLDSDTNFATQRITNFAGRSLRPSIDGDQHGRLYITWHDSRFGNWEVMMGYLLGSNVIPLFQQDPYYASIRNPEYKHSVGTIPLILKNDTNEVVCMNDITVNIYEDRTLENLETSVKRSDWPFAFTIPGAANDTTSEIFTNFNDWICQFFEDEYTVCDPYCFKFVCTSPEFDTALTSSIIESIGLTIVDLGFGEIIELSFRGSDTKNDPNAELQWTGYITVNTTGTLVYANLGLPVVLGKYKQVRIRTTLSEPIEPALVSDDIDIVDSEDDGFFHFDIAVNSVWAQGDTTLNVRASTGIAGEKRILLRFPIESVGITTIIDRASLHMTSTANKIGLFPVNIGLLDIADASTLDWSSGFDPATLPVTLSIRTWFIPATNAGEEYGSISLSGLVQNFVDRTEFSIGNYIGFEISWNNTTYTGDSDREFASFEHLTLNPPRLEVEYHDEPAQVDDGYITQENSQIWEQSNTLKIGSQVTNPSGQISSSRIYLRFPVFFDFTRQQMESVILGLTAVTTTSGLLPITVWLLDYDDASILDWSAAGFDVNGLPNRHSSRQQMFGSTSSNVATKIDVLNLFDSFVRRPGFVNGNAIGFEITVRGEPTAEVREFWAKDSAVANDIAPKLVYETGQRLSSVDNDGYHNRTFGQNPPLDANGQWNPTTNAGTIGFIGSAGNNVDLQIYFRFKVHAAAGANIVQSWLTFETPFMTNTRTARIDLLDYDDLSFQDWNTTGNTPQSGPNGPLFDPRDPPTATTIFADTSWTMNANFYGVMTALLQAYVDRPGFIPASSMGLRVRMIDDTNNLIGESWRTSRAGLGNTPVLHYSVATFSSNSDDDGVLYTSSGEWIQGEGFLKVSQTGNNKILIRFPVGVNSGTTDLSSVNLVLTSDIVTAGTLSTDIHLLDADDISTQDWTSGGFSILNIPALLGAVSFSIPATTIGSVHRADIKPLVDIFRSRTNYTPGFYIGLLIQWNGITLSGDVKSFVSVELGTESNIITKPEMEVLLQSNIAANNDDAWIDDVITATPKWEQFDSTLTLSRDFSGAGDGSNILLRFPVSNVSNLTDINNVFLSLTPSTTTSGTFGAKIHLLDVADASSNAWDDSFDPNNRFARSGTSVNFEIGATTKGTTVTSPSIKNLLEVFISRSDFRAGNYMGLEIAWDEMTSSDALTRIFDSKESSIVGSGTSPSLQIIGITNLPIQIYFPITSITVTSVAIFRLCLAPNEEVTAFLDLTPFTRIDQKGNAVGATPLPIGLAKNRTYFISLLIVEEDGNAVVMPEQFRSFSCETCLGKTSSWNLDSCSVKISIPNTTEATQFMNFQVTFYQDAEKTRKFAEFNAFPGHADLAYFTVEDEDPAQNIWQSNGLRISKQQSAELLLWPNLSPTAGVLCGIAYHVEIKSCQVQGTDTASCIEDDLQIFETLSWKCDCESVRWEPRFEDAPENLREIIRWKSSGSGFSDTRLTESIGVDNINPVIRMRSFLQGIIVYSTNRHEDANDTDDYKLFASVFNVAPDHNMYASAAQAITSLFSQIVHRSDIPLCKDDSSCFDSGGNRIPNSTMKGVNPALMIDQFDNLFLAFEEYITQPQERDATDCQEFLPDRQQIVKLHTCGLDPTDLFSLPKPDEDPAVPCKPTSIISESFMTSYEPAFLKIVRQIRVINEFVRHHITISGTVAPIVEKCDIEFEVVGGPEAVAIRLRNGRSDDWSVWHPFEPESGENVIEIKHTLTPGSGLKQVDFQVATYTGLMTTATSVIVADYLKVTHEIKFYKPVSETPVPDGSDLDRNFVKTLAETSAIWVDSNQLNSIDAIPVAAIRSPTSVNEDIFVQSSDYIFVEIIPSSSYMEQFSKIPDADKSNGSSGIEPIFDLLQQGGNDQFGLPTIWAKTEGIEVFRGVIEINKDNQATFVDGLALIITHFQQDCSSDSRLTASGAEYMKDPYNIVISGTPASTSDQKDVWEDDRNSIGQIKEPVQIRPTNEDPYFVFGDPDYRLKKQNE